MTERAKLQSGHRPPAQAFWKMVLSEAKLAWRTPIGIAYGLGFPIVLLIVFGSIPSFKRPNPELGGLTLVSLYLPILIVFSVAILALIGLSAPLAECRERGVLRRLSTTPTPPAWVLGAQLVVNAGIGIVGLILLMVIGASAFGVQGPGQVPGFILSLVLTAAALFAMGLWVAAVARTPEMAGAIGNALFYPMIFFAGLWIPRELMPSILRHISDYTPLGAAVQAMQSSMEGSFPTARPLLVLVAYAILFGYAAVRSFKWE